MKTYKGFIKYSNNFPKNAIFVFGANTEGRHSKGAALTARVEFGAEYGNPSGPQGRSYAIITKDLRKRLHPSIARAYIEAQIAELYLYASLVHPEQLFYVAYGIGKYLNGYTPQEMANMFSEYPIPDNMVFHEDFAKLLKLVENE